MAVNDGDSPLLAALKASLAGLQEADWLPTPVDEDRIVRYRRMGYSPGRISQLFSVPLWEVAFILRQHSLL